MPEGHLIHHYARLHDDALAGRVVRATSPQGRFEDGAATVDGHTLQRVTAHGKHLFYELGEHVVHVHLGRQGLFLWSAPPSPPPRSVRLRLEADGAAADLIAPARCELLDAEGQTRVVEGLGPDPLDDDADVERVWSAVSASSQAIGALLLDQHVVAGIGNVLRAELLSIAGIHPTTPGDELPRETFDMLWGITVFVMGVAALEGRIITRRPEDPEALDAVDEIDGRFVYGRDTCGRCGTPLDELEIAGRAINACPVCQPPAATR